MRKASTALIALFLVLGALSTAYATNYTYAALSYPGALYTYAYGINDTGTIVGQYIDTSGNKHSFSLSGTTYTSLTYPGANFTEADGINNAGTIVGGVQQPWRDW